MNANDVAKIFLEKEIPQSRLFNLGDFISHLEKRGIKRVGMEKNNFEFWDRHGLLRPILKVRSLSSRHLITERLPDRIRYDPVPLKRRLRNGEQATTLYHHWYLEPHLLKDLRKHAAERLIDLESRRFQDWSSFDDASGQTRVTYWYHPFHLVRFREIQAHIKLDVRFPQFKTYPLDEQVQKFYRGFGKIKRRAQDSEAKFLKQLSLIVAIEDKYLPQIRGHVSRADPNADWDSWSDSFDHKTVLKKTGFSIDEVVEMQRELAWQWHWLNELGDWHWLIRHADYSSRKQLRGKTRLAWDYYEFAEMLRLFLCDVTGKQQPNIEQLVSGGHRLSFSKADPEQAAETLVPGLLREFQIDPRYKVLFAIEGQTEEKFIEEWCELKKINLKRLGVKLFLFDGVNSLKSQIFQRELKYAKESDAHVFLVVDDENGASQVVKKLVSQGLLASLCQFSDLQDSHAFPVGGFVWKPCFEDANFTREQLADAWIAVLTKRSGTENATMSATALVDHMKARHQIAGTWIKALEQTVGRNRFSKPELGAALARIFEHTECDMTRLIGLVVRATFW